MPSMLGLIVPCFWPAHSAVVVVACGVITGKFAKKHLIPSAPGDDPS